MTIFIIILSFLSLYTVVKSCTSAGNDPYSSGSLVACCSGTNQTLKNWDSSNPSKYSKSQEIKTHFFIDNWYYLCISNAPNPSCTSAGNDPYSTSSLVACCSGTTQTLKNWDPSNPSKVK